MISLQIALSLTSPIVGSAAFNEQISIAGNNAIHNIQNIGTSREIVSLGDIAFPSGLVYIENLSATQTVTISADSDGLNVLAIIPAGGPPFITQGLAAAPYAVFPVADQVKVLACEL